MKELFGELQTLDVPEALSLLDKRITDESDLTFVIELKITKAKLLSSSGRWREGVDLLEECSRTPGSDESAAYFAAEVLVEEGYLSEAVEFLAAAERQIEISESTYYRDCILLLHAFCEAKLGSIERAEQLLNGVEDEDEVLFWLKSDPEISVFSVKELIAKGG